MSIKKLIAEFDRDITLFNFDDKIDELVETFPKGMSIVVKVETLEDKSVATLWSNPDSNAYERKVWQV